MCEAAGVQVAFGSDGSFTLKQSPGSYLFKKIVTQ
jgi:hypothetical protein